jgi:hypothetical protein
VRFHLFRKPRRRLLKIPPSLGQLPQIQPNPLGTEPAHKVARARHRQMATQDHPVETVQHSIDLLGMLGDKSLHGVVLLGSLLVVLQAPCSGGNAVCHDGGCAAKQIETEKG